MRASDIHLLSTCSEVRVDLMRYTLPSTRFPLLRNDVPGIVDRPYSWLWSCGSRSSICPEHLIPIIRDTTGQHPLSLPTRRGSSSPTSSRRQGGHCCYVPLRVFVSLVPPFFSQYSSSLLHSIFVGDLGAYTLFVEDEGCDNCVRS